jgi:hypothetical protein
LLSARFRFTDFATIQASGGKSRLQQQVETIIRLKLRVILRPNTYRFTADETISGATQFASDIGNGNRQDLRIWAKKESHIRVVALNNIGNSSANCDL